MGRKFTDFARCLRVAENTSKHSYETLVEARSLLIDLATESGDTNILLRAIAACNKLEKVIGGTHDAKIYAQAFKISEDTSSYNHSQLTQSLHVLTTILNGDVQFWEAGKARRRILKALKLTT